MASSSTMMATLSIADLSSAGMVSSASLTSSSKRSADTANTGQTLQRGSSGWALQARCTHKEGPVIGSNPER